MLFTCYVFSLEHLLLFTVGRHDKSQIYSCSLALWLFWDSKYRADKLKGKINKTGVFHLHIGIHTKFFLLPFSCDQRAPVCILDLIVLSFYLLFYSEHAPEIDSKQHHSGAAIQLVDWRFNFGFFG